MNTAILETQSTVSPRYLSISRVCDKLSRGKSWLYDKVKNDPTFPHSIRLGAWQVFIESDLDAWILSQTKTAVPPDSGKRLVKMLAGRGKSSKVAA